MKEKIKKFFILKKPEFGNNIVNNILITIYYILTTISILWSLYFLKEYFWNNILINIIEYGDFVGISYYLIFLWIGSWILRIIIKKIYKVWYIIVFLKPIYIFLKSLLIGIFLETIIVFILAYVMLINLVGFQEGTKGIFDVLVRNVEVITIKIPQAYISEIDWIKNWKEEKELERVIRVREIKKDTRTLEEVLKDIREREAKEE